MTVARILPARLCVGLAVAAPSVQAHHAAQTDQGKQAHMDAIATPVLARAA